MIGLHEARGQLLAVLLAREAQGALLGALRARAAAGLSPALPLAIPADVVPLGPSGGRSNQAPTPKAQLPAVKPEAPTQLDGSVQALADSFLGIDPSDCRSCGSDSCEGHAESAPHVKVPKPAAPKAERTLRFKSIDEILAEPAPVSIVEGILWSDSVSVLVGDSAAGKSFVVMDLAAAISDGREWFGRRVHRGTVAYVS